MIEQPDNDIMMIFKELKTLLQEGKDTTKFILISIIGGVVRTIVLADKQNFKSFAASVFVAAFVGHIVALWLSDSNLSADTIGAVVGIAAVCSADILKGIMKIAVSFSENPHRLINTLLNRKGLK